MRYHQCSIMLVQLQGYIIADIQVHYNIIPMYIYNIYLRISSPPQFPDAMQVDTSKCSPPNRTPVSERAMRAHLLLVPFSLSPFFALYLLYLDSSMSLHHIGIHMYLSALRPSRLTFYN